MDGGPPLDPLGLLGGKKESPQPNTTKPAVGTGLWDVDQALGRKIGTDNTAQDEKRKLEQQRRLNVDSKSPSYPSKMPASKPKSEIAAEEFAALAKYFEPLLGEQKMLVIPAVRIRTPGSEWRSGRLIGTNYRVRVAVPKGETTEEDQWLIKCGYLDIPWGTIREINQEGNRLSILTKDRRHLTIDVIAINHSAVASELGGQLLTLADRFAWPGVKSSLFSFTHADEKWSGQQENSNHGLDGWQIYDPMREYGRLDLSTDQFSNGAPWYISSLNKDYRLSETYPSWLVFPKKFPAEELQAVAEFRKKGRLPAMSWCAPHLNYAGLFRSSQTTEGIAGALGAFAGQGKCVPDEKLMMAIGNATGQADRLLVLDLRPRKVAYVNRVVGGGIEDTSIFRVRYCGIENIHHVRDAYMGMASAAENTLAAGTGTWFQDVGNSKWYQLLGTVLEAVGFVIEEMSQCRSVLVHCSDGWDRTAQNTSLVMLCLDPFYRTFTGFYTLIQKEFCSFGHRFRTRLANGEKVTSEYSPIFFQWLDCCYQIMVQNPNSFEFKPSLLPRIGQECISGKYGTFLSDCEKEMIETVMPYTISIWTELLQPEVCDMYRNDFYIPASEPLDLDTNQVVFKIWDDFWFSHSPLKAKRLKVFGSESYAEAAMTPNRRGLIAANVDPIADPAAALRNSQGGASVSPIPSSEPTNNSSPTTNPVMPPPVAAVEQSTPEPKVEEKRAPPKPWDFDEGPDPFK